jgi:hypothetical protein
MKIDEYESLTKLNEIAQKMDSLEMQERAAIKLMLEGRYFRDEENILWEFVR